MRTLLTSKLSRLCSESINNELLSPEIKGRISSSTQRKSHSKVNSALYCSLQPTLDGARPGRSCVRNFFAGPGRKALTSLSYRRKQTQGGGAVRAPTASGRQSWKSSEACSTLRPSYLPFAPWKTKLPPRAPSRCLRIYKLPHPDPCSGSTLRQPQKSTCCTWETKALPRATPDWAEVLNLDVWVFLHQIWVRVRSKHTGLGKWEGSRGPGTRRPGFLPGITVCQQWKHIGPLSEPHLLNPGDGDSRTFCLSNIITPGVRTSHGNSPGAPRQEIRYTNCGVATQQNITH